MTLKSMSSCGSLCARAFRPGYRNATQSHTRAVIQYRSFSETSAIVDKSTIPNTPPPSTSSNTLHSRIRHSSSKTQTESTSSTAAVEGTAWPEQRRETASHTKPAHSSQYSLDQTPTPPAEGSGTSTLAHFDTQTPEFLARMTFLATQAPHYITIHLHGKPYLVTQGDTIRLPFLMQGVMPGDVLRLDRASVLGSRDWTLRAGARKARPLSIVGSDAKIQGSIKDSGSEFGEAEIGRTNEMSSSTAPLESSGQVLGSSQIRHTRPKTLNRLGFVDPSLFVCRATVLGTESEPLRILEKTKRRQRHVRHIKSKHRYTILRISEVKVQMPEFGLD